MQWRTPITLAVLLMILLGAAYYGWQTVVDPATDKGASSTPTTPTKSTPKLVCVKKQTYPKGTTVQASSFKVNVYNAGQVSGQAGQVLAELHARGFQTGVADNPPNGVTAKSVTIFTSSPDSPRAALVAKQFKAPVQLLKGPDLAIGVDVVIGPGFTGMATGAPSSLTLHKATTVCTEYAKR